jgi:hypothetical protein
MSQVCAIDPQTAPSGDVDTPQKMPGATLGPPARHVSLMLIALERQPSLSPQI